jgi:hypothetical protein
MTALTPVLLPDCSISLASHVPAPVSETSRSTSGSGPSFCRLTSSKPSFGSTSAGRVTSAMRDSIFRCVISAGRLESP